ncbi:MAG: hypothetical protein IJ144_05880 [Prevotella sp.]|nr:hypothetical protein [Prevotella sp.]
MDAIHKDLLKKYHTLCGVLGMSDAEKEATLSAYGVDSSRDLDTHDLIDLCAKLSAEANKKSGTDDMDRLRKRVMAAIGSWLKSEGKFANSDIIKGIACRATGHSEFNKIPRERLRNLIGAFNNKVKDAEAVAELTKENPKVIPLIPKEQ